MNKASLRVKAAIRDIGEHPVNVCGMMGIKIEGRTDEERLSTVFNLARAIQGDDQLCGLDTYVDSNYVHFVDVMWEEDPTPTQDLFLKMDWGLLRRQKEFLDGCMTESACGLLHLVDALQDAAVKEGFATEKEVFG